MSTLQLFTLLLITSAIGCSQSQPSGTIQPGSIPVRADSLPMLEDVNMAGKGALLLTRFKSFDELKAVVQIEYFEDANSAHPVLQRRPQVRLRHVSDGREVTSVLTTGVSQGDISNAQKDGFWERFLLVLNTPYILFNRKDLQRVYALARRRGPTFGEGDVAFYDLAELMSRNISAHDTVNMPSIDLSEKGYINTFNHINAQALTTSIFSQTLADFLSDAHERFHMPELITGEFTEDQLADIENGPTDNYVDMINNEWGQELGKQLRKQYNISRKTEWTPELLENYLNDIQSYYSWAFQIGFEPIRSSDDVIIRFSNKINRVMKDTPDVR